MSLKEKALSGLVWTFIDTFLIKGLLFVVMLYLARILGPKEFGLFGMMSVFIGVGKTMVDSGMATSLIRDEKADAEDFSTVFCANMLLSIFIYSIVFLCSGLIAEFFNQPIIADLISVYCLVFIVIAFSSVQLTVLNKELNFRVVALVNLPSTVVGVLVGLILAHTSYGVWSIVWLYLVIEIVKTILFVIFSPFKPSIKFNKEKFLKHFNFGYKLMLSGLLNHIFKNIYNILIGKYFNPITLGYYERSRQLNDYPTSTLSGIISRVAYPMMAKIKTDKNKLKEVFRKVQSFAFFVISPLMFFLAAVAEPMFYILLGEEWLPAVPFFQVLTIASLFYPIHNFNLNILKVYGRSDWFLKLEIYKKLMAVIIIFITFQYGLMALIWSGVITSILALLINTYYTSKVIDYTPTQQVKDLFPILLFGVVSFGIAYLLVEYIELNNYLKIIFTAVIGSLLYLFISFVQKNNPIHYSLELIKNFRK